MKNELTLDEMLVMGDIENFLGAIRKIASIKVRNKSFAGCEPEDVVQEVLMKVYTSIEAYDPNKTKATTFFNVVIDNKLKDIFKSLSSNANLMVANHVPLTVGDDDDDHAQLEFALEDETEYACTDLMYDMLTNYNLTELEQKILKLKVVEFTNTEIAEMLGMSKQALNYHNKNLLKKLGDYRKGGK